MKLIYREIYKIQKSTKRSSLNVDIFFKIDNCKTISTIYMAIEQLNIQKPKTDQKYFQVQPTPAFKVWSYKYM